MVLLGKPAAANRQMRACNTVRRGLVLAPTQAFRVVRCSSVIDSFSAGFDMKPPIAQTLVIVKVLLYPQIPI